METKRRNICPVCHKEQSDSQTAFCDCRKCGFEYAFVTYFVSLDSKKKWLDKVEIYKEKYQAEQAHLDEKKLKKEYSLDAKRGKDENVIREKPRKRNISNNSPRKKSPIKDTFENISLVVDNSFIAYVDSRSKFLRKVNLDGREERINNVEQFCVSGRNSAIVYTDGGLQVNGDNSFGQCEVADIKDAIYVEVAANSIYVIRKDGSIDVRGVISYPKVLQWRHMKKITVGIDFVMGLTEDGRVICVSSNGEEELARNVIDIVAVDNMYLMLMQNGTVRSYRCDEDISDEVVSWKDIVAITTDGTYCIGLRSDGAVKMAGKARSFLDKGRSRVREWENIISMACCRSCIAGLTKNGELLLAGNFAGNMDGVIETFKKSKG